MDRNYLIENVMKDKNELLTYRHDKCIFEGASKAFLAISFSFGVNLKFKSHKNINISG